MKKIKYLIITCLSFAILSYGVIAFANGGTSSTSKDLSYGDVTGKFVAMVEGNSKIKLNIGNEVETYPLDSSIWIFRDQKKTTLENLKSGDTLELILNSSMKVTYIKAFSEVYLKAEVATVSVTTAPTVTEEPTPTVTPEPSPTITPNENKQIIIVKEDSQLIIEKNEQVNGNFQVDDDLNKDDHDDLNVDDHDDIQLQDHEHEGE